MFHPPTDANKDMRQKDKDMRRSSTVSLEIRDFVCKVHQPHGMAITLGLHSIISPGQVAGNRGQLLRPSVP